MVNEKSIDFARENMPVVELIGIGIKGNIPKAVHISFWFQQNNLKTFLFMMHGFKTERTY